MRVAALYDVHAMPWALEAVLADLGDVDAIVFGGDFVGGPCVDETLALIDGLDAVLVRGNAEDEDPRTATLPLTAELDGVTYCHATPDANTPMTTVFTPDEDLRAMFGERAGTCWSGEHASEVKDADARERPVAGWKRFGGAVADTQDLHERHLLDMAPPRILPHRIVETVMEVEMHEMLELAAGG